MASCLLSRRKADFPSPCIHVGGREEGPGRGLQGWNVPLSRDKRHRGEHIQDPEDIGAITERPKHKYIQL